MGETALSPKPWSLSELSRSFAELISMHFRVMLEVSVEVVVDIALIAAEGNNERFYSIID